MSKLKLQFWLLALFGLTLLACESTESDFVKPVASSSNSDGTSSVVAPTDGETCAEPYVFPLNFDQFGGRDAGDVSVTNDDTYLYVTVASDAGFDPNLDPDIFLWVGIDPNDFPLNSWAYPDLDPLLFDYTANVSGTEHTFMVPLAEIVGFNGCGEQELYLLIAANVIYESEGNRSFLRAFGGNIFVDGSAPWWYDSYTPACCEDDGEESCETAYAKFSLDMGYVFTDKANANPEGYPMLGIGTKWGWAGLFEEDGEYEFPIWAAAGKNDTNKGTLVGTLDVEIDGNDVTVTYNMSGGFTMSAVHIYVSNDAPETAAPGQYGWTVENDGMTSYSHTFEVDGDEDIWIIAHADVCGEYPSEEKD